jgi:hypothetical protein
VQNGRKTKQSDKGRQKFSYFFRDGVALTMAAFALASLFADEATVRPERVSYA